MEKKYNKMHISEALEALQQRLAALAVKRYTRENKWPILEKNPARLHSRLKGNNITRTGPPRAVTAQYWKAIWEEEASHSTGAKERGGIAEYIMIII